MADKQLLKKVISGLIKQDGRAIVEIAKDLGVSRQRLGQYRKGVRFPSADFIQRWQNTFGQNLMELMENETGKETNVSRETGKPTSVQNEPAVTKKLIEAEVYRKIVEGGTEYLLVPRTAFEGKYRFIPIEEIEMHSKELERKDNQIQGLYELFKMIASGLTLDPTKIQEAKKNAGV